MRRTEDTPLDPEIAAQLDAIDATLAGDPVDPQYAELAELALLLRAERPSVSSEFAESLDRRVAARFGPPPDASPRPATEPRPVRGLLQRDWMAPLAGLAAGCVAVVVAVVVLGSGGGSSSSSTTSLIRGAPSSGGTSTSASSSVGSGAAGSSSSEGASGSASARSSSAGASSAKTRGNISGQALTPNARAFAPANGAAATAASGSSAPAPTPNGRKIVQSAQLALGASPAHMNDVAQEVFFVAGREHAVVNNSNVTAGAGGYAQFQLSVPSSALQATMTALSQLQYATVTSRTDSTQDVNGQYLYDNRKLADDQALRASLLKQLAHATTQAEIDSLKVRIHDAEAAIGRDESTLRSLNHRIDFSQVMVTINGATMPTPGHSGGHSGSGFTLGKAAHDAGRVLTVAAGVALITLAALLPLALVGALVWWIASSVRRRRREQALDMA